MKKIPLFVITFERLEATKAAINSYRKFFGDAVDIIIQDNGSEYPPMVAYLKEKEREGIKIYRRSKLRCIQDLSKIALTVEYHLKYIKPVDYYIVTDCDIYFDKADSEMFEYYAWLLDKFPKIHGIAPMLEIRDIPEHYPMRESLLKDKARLWDDSNKQVMVSYKGEERKVYHCSIDTTFLMRKASTWCTRCMGCLSTMEPYIAKHWDWYINPANIPPGQQYYMKHAHSDIVHYSKLDSG